MQLLFPTTQYVTIQGHLPVQSAKDLGVILDSNLTFDDHIKTTASECVARPAQISRIKHCLDRTSLLTAINALVFSKLYYCSSVWANTTERNIRKLQAEQNFACRIVRDARKYDHVTPHLRESFQGLSSCSYCQANTCEENPKFNASVKIRNENSNCMAL